MYSFEMRLWKSVTHQNRVYNRIPTLIPFDCLCEVEEESVTRRALHISRCLAFFVAASFTSLLYRTILYNEKGLLHFMLMMIGSKSACRQRLQQLSFTTWKPHVRIYMSVAGVKRKPHTWKEWCPLPCIVSSYCSRRKPFATSNDLVDRDKGIVCYQSIYEMTATGKSWCHTT